MQSTDENPDENHRTHMIRIRKIKQLPFFGICLILLLIGCDSDLSVTPGYMNAITIGSLDRIAANPGDVIAVTGKNLSSRIATAINDRAVDLEIIDSKSATFVFPDDLAQGIAQVTLQ